MRKAYGMNRTAREFANCGIEGEKFFLDTDATMGQARLDLLLSLQKGDVVVVLTMADFGKGKAQLKAVAAIRKTGAAIEVVDEEPAKSGRPSGIEWTPEKLNRALYLWGVLSEKDALLRIKIELGIETARNHMNYQKRKAAAELLKK